MEQISPDIPAEKAWKQGRRVYVRCGYKSRLNDQVRDLGGKWDRDEGALWVGSGKLAQVIPLVLAAAEVSADVQAVKDAGRWVKIPYDAAGIREQAKKLGAKWDGDRKEWAMPSDEALAEVQRLIADRDDARKAQPKAPARPDVPSEAEVIAASGRTLTGQRGTASGRLEGRGKRAWAEAQKPQPGEVRKAAGRGRVLVLSCTADFLSYDDIEDQSPGQEPGWYYSYAFADVEPDAGEIAADQARAAETADGAEIAAALSAAREVMEWKPEADAGRDPVPAITGSIEVTSGAVRDGTLYLLADGRVMWRHPGYYDDYRACEGITSAPGTVAAIRALIAAGPRIRSHGSQALRVSGATAS